MPLPSLRPLLLAALLVGLPSARPAAAQDAPEAPPASTHAGHGAVEPPQLPAPRPALVTGELRTARFRILYTARAEGHARSLSERIEGARTTFQALLGRDWPGVTEVRVAAGRREFEALALPGGAPPGWAKALAYPAHNIVLLDGETLVGADGLDTLWHELSHVALGRLGTGWPRWFQEGLAVQLTGERFAVSRYTTLFRAVQQDSVYRFEDLAGGWPELPWDVELAYAQSAAFVGWLRERYGTAGLGALIDHVRGGDPFETAFGKAFRTSLMLEERDWRAELPSRYGWLPVTTASSLALALAALLVVPAAIRRQRQKAERLLEMELEEAAEEAARRLAEAEELAEAEALARAELRAHAELRVQAELRAEAEALARAGPQARPSPEGADGRGTPLAGLDPAGALARTAAVGGPADAVSPPSPEDGADADAKPTLH
jgi:hypothetical protein